MMKMVRALPALVRRAAGPRPVLATLLACCVTFAAITNVIGLLGLTGGGVTGAIISVGLAIVIATASAVALAQAIEAEEWPPRAGWIVVWLVCACISVLTAYAFWFAVGSSEQLTDRSARDAAREATLPLTRFATAYALLAEKSASLGAESKAKMETELTIGGTCEAGIGPHDGPRRRLRAGDYAALTQYATEFAQQRSAIDRAMNSLDQLYRENGPGFYSKASTVLYRAYAVTVAAAEDPNLKSFKSFLANRIAEGQHELTDPQSGKYRCSDPELEAGMRAAQEVDLPPAPAKPPEVAEPTLTAAAARPFNLIAHPAQFSLDLDVRPVLLGSTLDFLQAVLVLALRGGRSRRAPGQGVGGRSFHGPDATAGLRQALARPSELSAELQRLGRQFSAPGSWMRLLDRYTVSLPRRRLGGDDYLLVADSKDEDSLAIRGIALFLKSNDKASLHQVTPMSRLPPRWQQLLGEHVHQDAQIQVYKLSNGLLNELIRDAVGCPAPSPATSDHVRPTRSADPHNTPAFDEGQLGFGL